MNKVQMDIDIQHVREQQENDLYMGDECPFDMSMGVDPHQIQSYETDTNIVQSSLQQHGPPGPYNPCQIQTQILIFQLFLYKIILYYQFVTFCTDKSHIEELFEQHTFESVTPML